jgi:hypothetical protein
LKTRLQTARKRKKRKDGREQDSVNSNSVSNCRRFVGNGFRLKEKTFKQIQTKRSLANKLGASHSVPDNPRLPNFHEGNSRERDNQPENFK